MIRIANIRLILNKDSGERFVQMPSRKKRYLCKHCKRAKNDFDAHFCSSCGFKIPEIRYIEPQHEDMVNPCDSETRKIITDCFIDAYERAIEYQKNNPVTNGDSYTFEWVPLN